MSDIVTEVFDAEGNMRQVYDIALILHDYMEEAGDLWEDRKAGLLILTAELLQTGERLRASWYAMHEAVSPRAHAERVARENSSPANLPI